MPFSVIFAIKVFAFAVVRAKHFEGFYGVWGLEGDFFALVETLPGEIAFGSQDFLPRSPSSVNPVISARFFLGLGLLGGEFGEEILVDGDFVWSVGGS